jgi:hypothetical protein
MRMKWAGHAVHMGERRNGYRVLVGNPEQDRPLGRPILARTISKWMLEKPDGVV